MALDENKVESSGPSSDSGSNSKPSTPEGLEKVNIEQRDDGVEILKFAPGDPENPFNWSLRRKWILTLTRCFISILTGLPAGSYGAGNEEMSRVFNISNDGFPYSSVSINIVGGTITDLFYTDLDRSLPMSIFGLTSVVGIALGPYIGGAITSQLSFRWIYWIQLIFDGGLLPVFWFILRKTRGDVILGKRAAQLRKETGRNIFTQEELDAPSLKERMKISFSRPTQMLFSELVVFAFTMWISFVWGVLYLFQTSVSQTFAENYGFSTNQCGLIQLAISVGAIVGTAVNPIQDRMYRNSSRKNSENPGKPIPEARVYSSVVGSLLFTVGLFWYGWSSYPHVHWIVPTIGIAIVGLGIYSVYMAVVNYFADSYQRYAASALAAASLGRNAFGAFLPLASKSLYTNLGFQWALSLLGFIGLILTAAPLLIVWKGQQFRARSPFMTESTFDEGENEHRKKSRHGENGAVEEGLMGVKAEGVEHA